jgi:hypothetical protein
MVSVPLGIGLMPWASCPNSLAKAYCQVCLEYPLTVLLIRCLYLQDFPVRGLSVLCVLIGKLIIKPNYNSQPVIVELSSELWLPGLEVNSGSLPSRIVLFS